MTQNTRIFEVVASQTQDTLRGLENRTKMALVSKGKAGGADVFDSNNHSKFGDLAYNKQLLSDAVKTVDQIKGQVQGSVAQPSGTTTPPAA